MTPFAIRYSSHCFLVTFVSFRRWYSKKLGGGGVWKTCFMKYSIYQNLFAVCDSQLMVLCEEVKNPFLLLCSMLTWIQNCPQTSMGKVSLHAWCANWESGLELDSFSFFSYNKFGFVLEAIEFLFCFTPLFLCALVLYPCFLLSFQLISLSSPNPQLPWLFISEVYVTFLNLKRKREGTWQAQAVEHATLDLRVLSLSPRLGIEIT